MLRCISTPKQAVADILEPLLTAAKATDAGGGSVQPLKGPSAQKMHADANPPTEFTHEEWLQGGSPSLSIILGYNYYLPYIHF